MKVVARVGHEIPERAPIRVAVGDEVDVGERDGDWPEFVYVTTADGGGSGWVPGRFLSETAGRAVVRTAYDTTELPTVAGDVLEVLGEDRQSGWLWCRAAAGREGWVPVSTLDEPA